MTELDAEKTEPTEVFTEDGFEALLSNVAKNDFGKGNTYTFDYSVRPDFLAYCRKYAIEILQNKNCLTALLEHFLVTQVIPIDIVKAIIEKLKPEQIIQNQTSSTLLIDSVVANHLAGFQDSFHKVMRKKTYGVIDDPEYSDFIALVCTTEARADSRLSYVQSLTLDEGKRKKLATELSDRELIQPVLMSCEDVQSKIPSTEEASGLNINTILPETSNPKHNYWHTIIWLKHVKLDNSDESKEELGARLKHIQYIDPFEILTQQLSAKQCAELYGLEKDSLWKACSKHIIDIAYFLERLKGKLTAEKFNIFFKGFVDKIAGEKLRKDSVLKLFSMLTADQFELLCEKLFDSESPYPLQELKLTFFIHDVEELHTECEKVAQEKFKLFIQYFRVQICKSIKNEIAAVNLLKLIPRERFESFAKTLSKHLTGSMLGIKRIHGFFNALGADKFAIFLNLYSEQLKDNFEEKVYDSSYAAKKFIIWLGEFSKFPALNPLIRPKLLELLPDILKSIEHEKRFGYLIKIVSQITDEECEDCLQRLLSSENNVSLLLTRADPFVLQDNPGKRALVLRFLVACKEKNSSDLSFKVNTADLSRILLLNMEVNKADPEKILIVEKFIRENQPKIIGFFKFLREEKFKNLLHLASVSLVPLDLFLKAEQPKVLGEVLDKAYSLYDQHKQEMLSDNKICDEVFIHLFFLASNLKSSNDNFYENLSSAVTLKQLRDRLCHQTKASLDSIIGSNADFSQLVNNHFMDIIDFYLLQSPGFDAFKAHLIKISTKQKNPQHEFEYKTILYNHSWNIYCLYKIMGKRATQLLKSYSATSVLRLNRFLFAFHLDNKTQIGVLRQVLAPVMVKKVITSDFDKIAEILKKITCLIKCQRRNLLESSVLFDLNLFLVKDCERPILESLSAKIDNELVSVLHQLLKIDKVLLKTHLGKLNLADLLTGVLNAQSSRYYTVMKAMLKVDLSQEDMGSFLHSEGQDEASIGLKIALHNKKIKEIMGEKGINYKIATNPGITTKFDMIIGENPQILQGKNETKAIVNKLWSCLLKLESKLESKKSETKKFRGLVSTIRTTVMKQHKEKDTSDLSGRDLLPLISYKLAPQLKSLKDFCKTHNSGDPCLINFCEAFLQLVKHNQDYGNTLLTSLLKSESFRIEQWDKRRIDTYFLGNYVDCCLATNAGRFYALIERRLDDAMFMHVVVDVESELPVALTWLFFAVDQNDQACIVVNYIEIKTHYGKHKAKSDLLVKMLLKFTAETYAPLVCQGAVPLYIRPLTYGMVENESIAIAEFVTKSFTKLGGCFSPEAGVGEKEVLSKAQSEEIAPTAPADAQAPRSTVSDQSAQVTVVAAGNSNSAESPGEPLLTDAAGNSNSAESPGEPLLTDAAGNSNSAESIRELSPFYYLESLRIKNFHPYSSEMMRDALVNKKFSYESEPYHDPTMPSYASAGFFPPDKDPEKGPHKDTIKRCEIDVRQSLG